MSIGETLRAIRKHKGIKQKDFAPMIGVTQTHLSSLENGNRTPSVHLIEKCAELFKVELTTVIFLALDEENVPKNKLEGFKVVKSTLDNFLKETFDL